jgi:predicted permease
VQHVDPGFDSKHVLTMRTTLPGSKYGLQAPRVAFYRRVLDDVRAQPGVVSAAYTSWIPMTMRGGIWPVFLPGQSREAANAPTVSVRYVTSDYFATMKVPVKIGRAFTESDSLNADKVAIVSDSFVKAHWPGQDPRGKQFFLAFMDRTVVGVAGDVRVRGLERESEPQVYLPYQQEMDNMMTFYMPKDLVVRMSDDTHTAVLSASVRAIVAKADPELPVADVQLLSNIVESDSSARSTQVLVLGAFAGVECLLAAVGLHGLLAFMVAARTREIGVRLALGASPRQVLGLITQRGLLLAVAGVAIGADLAYLAGRSMQALLAGVDPADVLSMLFAVGVSFASALAGTLLPALRASRIAPTEALRAD